MAEIIKIIEIEPDTYSLKVKFDDDTVHETVCRVDELELPGGKKIKGFTFDSKDFNTRIMKGEIDARDVTRAVARFRAGT